MTKTRFELEKKYLAISAGANVLVGCVGVAVALESSSQAIFLDGLFNLTYFAMALFTLKVAALLPLGDDERFPYGYAFFEPLVNGIKGTLVLGVTIMAAFGAVRALLSGGTTIAAGVAIAYGAFATVVCGAIAVTTHRGGRLTGSPLVKADAANWVINAAVSFCVLVAFAGILVLDGLELTAYTPFVDPLVVLTVAAISISVPVRMAWQALMTIMNRAPDADTVAQITQMVDAGLSSLPVQERFVRVIEPGRQRMVTVHVVLPGDYRPDGLGELDSIRLQTFQSLRAAHPATILDVFFTADRQWGAPLSDGGAG
jgi:cation diffusion facilitator family transporter